MRIAGVIAEYNPFHDGHAYHLRQTGKNGADAVVAVMSGNYVQRGTPAIMSGFSRAKAAVQCGVDLVVELPVPWAVGRAQTFAEGAVSVLRQAGCIEVLSFGSECAAVSLLQKTAAALQDEAVKQHTKQILTDGNITFAAARQQSVGCFYGEAASSALCNPNDTLAVEYMLAADRQKVSFSYLAVPRLGRHDTENSDGFPSASQIRSTLLSDGTLFGCPKETAVQWQQQTRAGCAPVQLERMERSILADWRTASPAEIAELPDVSEGLENRLIEAARNAFSLTSFYDLAKTKRYTHARIRRIVLSRFLRLKQSDILPAVPYIRVLAIGKRGQDVLREMKKTCSVPILTRNSDRQYLDKNARHIFDIECQAAELYTCLQPEIHPAGAYLQTPIYIFP